MLLNTLLHCNLFVKLYEEIAMLLITKLFSVLVLSDFVSGFIHWLEDVYAKPGMPIVSKIAEDNQLHHTKPRAFLDKNWFQSSWDALLASGIVLAIAWWFNALSWPVILFAILVSNANQVHKWAHMNKQEKGGLVTLLQTMHVLQSAREHAKHHTGDKNTHYCVMTNLVNPALEKVQFWRRLEWFNETVFGLKAHTKH
jgi:plasmanylethanolamine desaturase